MSWPSPGQRLPQWALTKRATIFIHKYYQRRNFLEQRHTTKYARTRQVTIGIWHLCLTLVNGVMTTVGYAVQPANAQPFEFSVLGGPYAGLMNAFGGAGAVSISSAGGEMSNYGGFTQISGYVDLSNYAGLGDLIEEQMVNRQLPRIRDAYWSGSVIAFASLRCISKG